MKEAFIRSRNRGYAFAVLSVHAPRYGNDKSLAEWVGEVLTRAGLPSYEALRHAAYARIDELARGLPVRSALDRARDTLLQVGRERFLRQGALPGQVGIPYDPDSVEGPMPWMFDRDAELFHLGQEPIDQSIVDPEALYQAEWELLTFTQNLLQGCRGLS